MFKSLYIFIGVVVTLVCVILQSYIPSINASGMSLESSVMANTEDVELGLKEGNRAPDFHLETLEGTELKLSDLKGKIVFLNFWASWCPPCKSELPHMQNFYEAKKENNIEILAVNLTTAERNADDLGAFIKSYGITFPVLLDIKGEVGQTYQAFTIPTSYLIDKQGIIRKKIIGPMNMEMMENLAASVDN